MITLTWPTISCKLTAHVVANSFLWFRKLHLTKRKLIFNIDQAMVESLLKTQQSINSSNFSPVSWTAILNSGFYTAMPLCCEQASHDMHKVHSWCSCGYGKISCDAWYLRAWKSMQIFVWASLLWHVSHCSCYCSLQNCRWFSIADPLPLRRAKINQQASIRKAKGATEVTKEKRETAGELTL